MKFVNLKCSNCGGQKFIGESYYAFGTYYVDVTCILCGDSKDIEVEKLEKFLKAIGRRKR
jgi:hypothetical protein